MHFSLWCVTLFVGQLMVCHANSLESNLYSNIAAKLMPSSAPAATMSPAAAATNSPTSVTRAISSTSKQEENVSLLSTRVESVTVHGGRPTELPVVVAIVPHTSTSQAPATKTATETAPLQTSTSKSAVNTETVFAATENTSPKPDEDRVTIPAVLSSSATVGDVAAIASSTIVAERIAPSSTSAPTTLPPLVSVSSEEMNARASHITITPIDLAAAGVPHLAILNVEKGESAVMTLRAEATTTTTITTRDAPVRKHSNFVEQKLDNGLYRVKLAEIITDEFDNGLGDRDDETNSIPKNYRAPSYNNGKINIADLYPSKLEDFSPIIRESNEKLIKEKNLLTGSGISDGSRNGVTSNDPIIAEQRMADGAFVDDGYQQIISVQSDEQQTNDNGAFNSIGNNIPTTKIEIELIDEPTAKDEVKVIAADIGSDNEDDGVIDLTAKLQENDGVISAIEHDFMKVGSNDERDEFVGVAQQTSTTPVASSVAPITVNRPINTMEFIERRVKKHDPTFKNRYPNANGLGRSDVANTKFNNGNDDANAASPKSEFSTTKFYNSKELSNELHHENMTNKVMVEMKTNELVVDRPQGGVLEDGITTKSVNKAPTVTSAPIKANGNDAKPTAAVKKPTDNQKILFFNVNGKPNQREEERLEKDREQIIKEKDVVGSKGDEDKDKVSNGGQRPNMHLYVIHDDATSSKVDEKVNQTSTSAAVTASEATSQQSYTTPATILASNHTNPTSRSTPHLVVTKVLVANFPKNGRPYSRRSRPRVLTHLQEKINSLDCDMQNAMPKDANVWRGNETHELNLPTTVSQSHILI